MFAFVAAKTIRRLKKNNLIDEEEDREWVEDEGEEEEDGGMGDKERERERGGQCEGEEEEERSLMLK